MNLLIRFVYYYIMNFMVIWVSGCSNKCNNVQISNLDVMRSRILLTSKLVQNTKIIHDSGVLYGSLNKHGITNSSRYVYNYLNKGSYSSCCYTVKPGDTLFYIAWITGNNYHMLAEKNNISINDILKIGQILQVDGEYKNLDSKSFKKNSKNNVQLESKRSVFYLNTAKLDSTHLPSLRSGRGVDASYVDNKSSKNFLISSKRSSEKLNNIIRNNSSVQFNQKKLVSNISFDVKQLSSISWSWPTVGRIVNSFSYSEGGNKGIDISGVSGQAIYAARCGKVVYSGNDLLGYGNLIIIKHDNDFLSTYAHNDKIFVVEQQNVARGQKIATMGSTGSSVIKLRFEIRYKGKSVDPLCYLPK